MTTNGADLVSNDLLNSLAPGPEFDIPSIDITEERFQFPGTLDDDLYRTVRKLENADLTTGVVGGTGAFDVLMKSTRAHLREEYDAGRITGAEYTKAYIAMTQGAMANATQFLLSREQAFWEAQKGQVAVIAGLTDLELQKLRITQARLEAVTTRVNFARAKISLALEDLNFGTAKFNLEQILPQELELKELQGQSIVSQTALTDKQLDRLVSEISLTDAQVTKLAKDTDFVVAQTGQVTSQIELTEAQTLKLASDKSLVDAEVLKSSEELTLLNRQVTKLEADVLLTEAQTSKLGSDKALVDAEVLKNAQELQVLIKQVGVSLNTKETAALRYLYQFFYKHMPNQATDSEYYQLWKAKQEQYEQEAQSWVDWRDEQGFVRPGDLFPGKQPTFPRPPVPPWSGIQIRHEAPSDIDFDIDIGWRAISEKRGTGLAKPDAKPGDLWWEVRTPHSFNLFGQDGQVITKKSNQKDDYVILWWQVGSDSWRALHIQGLVHNNFVYLGKDVETTATEAILDDEPSGFIVPLQYSTYTEMGLIPATQMSTSCMHLVLNSYKVVKKKWYQTGLFKIVLIIAIIATIYFTGGFSAQGLGVLGSNLAVGMAVGLTGIAAIIVGVVANAVAAMVITSLITKGASAAFGAKIGSIVGVLASIVAINGLTNMAGSGSFAINFGSMARAENLLKLAGAAGNAYSGFVEASVADIARETQEMLDEYKSESEKISALYEELIGSDRGVIDPMSFTDAGNAFVESPGSFLGRTLMTGSDIADLSMEMLSNFADITLSTEISLDA